MSIRDLTVQGALFGSSLFFNEAANSTGLPDEQAVAQLAIFTTSGAAVGALVSLGITTGEKLCPQALSVATKITQSLSDGYFYVMKGTGRCLLKLSEGLMGGIVSTSATAIAVIGADTTHLIAADAVEQTTKQVSACPDFFKTSKHDFFASMSTDLPIEVRNQATDATFFTNFIIIPAVTEEILFRGIIQDLALKRIPSYILKKVSPGKETLLQTKTYTCARLILSSAAFAAAHLTNANIHDASFIQVQLIGTFASGMIFGAIKEAGLGLETSMIAHAFHNRLALHSCFD